MSNIENKFVSIRINNQLFGIPAEQIKEILHKQVLNRIPLCSKDVIGVFNLRGRIVTMIDICHRLELSGSSNEKDVFVIIEHKGDLFGIIGDSIGEVLTLSKNNIKPLPSNLGAFLKDMTSGVSILKDDLLIILNSQELLSFSKG